MSNMKSTSGRSESAVVLLFRAALAVLEQGGGIKNGVVAARHEFMSHVSAVVECDLAPSIGSILSVNSVRLER